ncbi:hypothetical protein HMPREF1640_01985 [Prevotella sp. S7-1-8]|nr:hypothetical protein HMPREF1640_01985 [Prevotella sp. S7-1-8]
MDNIRVGCTFYRNRRLATRSLKAKAYTLTAQQDGFGGNKNEITVGSVRKRAKKMMISDKKYKFAKSKPA